jgi:hypothetical protein
MSPVQIWFLVEKDQPIGIAVEDPKVETFYTHKIFL